MSLSASRLPLDRPRDPDLRARIGWLCQGLRLAVCVWAAWTLALILWMWRTPEAVARAYGVWWKLDLVALPTADFALAFGVVLADWALVAALCIALWRMFGLYLAGEVFTRLATQAMRRVGLIALVAIAFDFVARPLVSLLLTMHLPQGVRLFNLFARPEDLLHLLFACFVLALAHIFAAAADLADENAAIV